ncbi:hypothetical protein QTP70_028937 [Hemibagrus guttatus]|uniref:Colony stimulating factor 1b (macrophage) n=1 Tax=Hemibagrus guttatus TaxID=175788 RepID=A0AAE0Q3S6_9TELE|nr:hypothetical protein QTP70_028937 [Hemibagrus guttatus]
MNTHTTVHKAKIRHLCSCLVLCLHLASGAVPCQHSVTEEHLQTLRKLIMNQVQNGCSISFKFTERQHLSDICYIKAAFPHILDLLNAHFTYAEGSDNYNYTSSLKELIYNIYSQQCLPPINEEIEENPLKFARLYTSLPQEGLQKTEQVLQMYKKLMSENDKPVNWNCEDEYATNVPESTTALPTQTTDSRCTEGTEDRSDQRSRDRVKKDSVDKEYQLIQIFVCTTFLITAACILLLFIPVLFYCKQQRVRFHFLPCVVLPCHVLNIKQNQGSTKRREDCTPLKETTGNLDDATSC